MVIVRTRMAEASRNGIVSISRFHGLERRNGADTQAVTKLHCGAGGARQVKGEIPPLVYECPIILVICRRSSGVSPTNSNPELTLEVCRTMATVVTG